MHTTGILQPVVALMLLTLIVWLVMYARRIAFMRANRIGPQRLATPERVAEIIDESAQHPANNLKNLFELPVVFYALCILLFAAGMADAIDVAAAWAFVALRLIHSAIHCTINHVMSRFLAYVAGAAVLWMMVLRTAVRLV